MLLSLLLSLSAYAGAWNGRAVLPHCKQINLHVSSECQKQMPPELLATIMPVADKLVGDEQVRQAKHYGHKQISSELKKSIQARKAMLACLDKPKDKGCATRVKLLRSQLENNVHRLRIALALANVPMAAADRSVGTHIHLPGSLGGTELPPLTDAEAESARAFQKSAVAAAERVGLEKLRADHDLRISAEDLTAKCHAQDPDYLEACSQAQGIHEASFLEFRRSMGKIAGNIIADLPFTLSFRSAPISDEELKKQLQASLDALTAWNDENGDIDEDDDSKWSNFLSENLAYTDQFVAKHPEACPAVERNLRNTGRMQFAKDTLNAVTDVTAVTLTCSVASPLVCISASGIVLGKDTHTAYGEWSEVRRRLAAADHENPQASQVAAADAYRDLLTTIALDSLQVEQYAAWSLKGGEDFYPMKDFIKDLEKRHPKYQKVAGEMFSTLYDNVKDDLPEAVGATVGETAIAELHAAPPGSYDQWLRSDAFTARVFEAFEKQEMK